MGLLFNRRLLLLLLTMGWLLSAAAQVGISPRTLDVALDEDGRSHSFRLFNLSENEYRVRISVSHWTMDEQNQVELIPSTAESLDQWMIVNPLAFTIAAGESQTVRVGFRPQLELAEGEYRAMVYFDQELPPDPKPESRQLRSRFRLGAAVYAHVGEIKPRATIDEVTIEGSRVNITISNQGNTHVRLDGQWSIWSASDYPGATKTIQLSGLGKKDKPLPAGILAADWLPRTPVLPGHTRVIYFNLESLNAPVGSYILDMDAQFADAALDKAVEFDWAGHAENQVDR
ncbi:MAG: hypothetical protein Tsb002_09670 [Wenzhouxiangellaceae bacterium]